MISAFLKKTFDNKQINLIKPLQVYIKDAYGKGKEKDVKGALEEIQQYRDNCNVDDQSVSPSKTIPQYERYLAYILMLEKRFSWGKSGKGVFSKASKVEVWFKWADSYRHTKIEQSMDIKLERFSIIFNLAALKSLHAVKLSEQDEEGLKEACKLFKESAGVFAYLAEDGGNDAIQFVQSLDIQTDSAKFLSSLMLAQAQACFAEMVCHLNHILLPRSSLLCEIAIAFTLCLSMLSLNIPIGDAKEDETKIGIRSCDGHC